VVQLYCKTHNKTTKSEKNEIRYLLYGGRKKDSGHVLVAIDIDM